MKDYGVTDRLKEEESLNKLHKHTGSLEMFLDPDLFKRNLKFMQDKLWLSKSKFMSYLFASNLSADIFVIFYIANKGLNPKDMKMVISVTSNWHA